jgi:hypothetical protein
MSLIRILMVMLALVPAVGTAIAQPLDSKGIASVSFDGKLTPAIKQTALEKAKVNALDRLIAQSDMAKSRNYELARDSLLADIDTYILSATILSEEGDEKAGRYTVSIRAEINGPRLENALRGSSVVANTPTAQKSLMTFVFVARQQQSVQSFDDKVYKRTDAKATGASSSERTRDASESEAITGNSVSTSDKILETSDGNSEMSTSVTIGGSTTGRADVVAWVVTQAAEINSVMTGSFTAAGYEVVEAEYVGQLDVDSIRADYGTGDDLSPATLRNAVKGVKAAGDFDYLALGRLDVGMKDKDPASGLTRVYVTASGKVLDVSGSYPKTVSSVGPAQYAGVGPSEAVARTNALRQAATIAAEQMINELNARGVR